jgi:two-component system phosphate regulon sensor histidine kinase PhoR
MAGYDLPRKLWAGLAGMAVLTVLVAVAFILMGLGQEVTAVLVAHGGENGTREVTSLLVGRVLVAAGVALILALPVGAYLSRRLVMPLGWLADGAERIAAGEEVVSLPTGTGGEVGRLARAVRDLDEHARSSTEDQRLDRHRLATVLAGMVEGVVAVDAKDRVVHMNAAARRILRSPPGEMLGRRVWELTRVIAVSEVLAEAREASTEVSREATVTEGSRGQVLQLLAAPLNAPDGEPAGAVVMLHDITDRRRLEEARTAFVANVSHELKTPLTAIAVLVETLLEDDGLDTSTRQRFLTKIRDQGTRLTAMVRDLLDLSRLESGEIHREFEPLDLRSTIRHAMSGLQTEADRRGVQVEVLLPERPLVMIGDDRALGRMLTNLLENAIRYTPAGGSVQVRAALDDGRVVIELQDDGIGIEERHHERLFERFYRADEGRSREVGGTGLGLSIVKHVVVAHQGQVSLRSAPGEGSTFRVSLPAGADENG